MQKNIKLTLLGAMLFVGAALYADDKGKGAVTPTVQVEQRGCRLKGLCTDSVTFITSVLKNKYTWLTVAGVAALGLSAYFVDKYRKAHNAKERMV